MKGKNRKPKKRLLFDPDKVSTSINRALSLDLAGLEQVYESMPQSPLHFAAHRQATELLKKYCPTTQDKERLELETFDKFMKVNEHMGETNKKLSFPHGETRIQSSLPYMDKVHLRARALIHTVLGSFSFTEFFEECRNSSGSTIGVPFLDTSVEAKLSFPVSVTSEAVNLYQQAMIFDNALKTAVENFNSQCPLGDPWELVEGSRATTVDKTETKRRMICVEPTGNMFLQQGLMYMLYSRMAKVGLNVETLPMKHKVLARESSITGVNATIDWSSASDCVSIKLLQWVLPPVWFRVIDQVRSKTTTINGERLELNMISTMGNAVTFPLETLVFWAYAHAVILTEEGTTNSLHVHRDRFDMVSVFGDDCIVPTWVAPRYIEVCSELGFIVNDEKSFYGTEQFRESCGGDYLTGFDVRPFSLKAPQSTRQSALEPWLYIITNSLLQKYMVYFGKLAYVYDRHLWRVLFALFRKYKIEIKLVPSWFPDDAGLKLSHDILRFKRHYRFSLSRIDKSKHGTYSFNFCRFVYPDRRSPDEFIRYALWLKKPVCSERKVTYERPKRVNGGYVVAKSLTCHWYVPRVKRAP